MRLLFTFHFTADGHPIRFGVQHTNDSGEDTGCFSVQLIMATLEAPIQEVDNQVQNDVSQNIHRLSQHSNSQQSNTSMHSATNNITVEDAGNSANFQKRARIDKTDNSIMRKIIYDSDSADGEC